QIPVPGKHMVHNALAAIGVGVELGVDVVTSARALASFPGVARRSEVVSRGRGPVVVDDYGHHPTEIRETLAALRAAWLSDGGRLVVLFQPHRFSRTQELYAEFLDVFADADRVIVTDIYSAGEPPIPGVTGEGLAQSLRHPAAQYAPDPRLSAAELIDELGQSDVLLTLGAGDISSLAHEIAQLLMGEPTEGRKRARTVPGH
ncbi:MAG: UDP-N-acetylmuramate--L-alanine ligase, partial [Bdellovibrionales bacterium]|nr:UDP-N-acetylmuramate--L-alanine ligase [Bdellovibrionales bacterium]